MRLTTWSTLTNATIVSIVALLSLVPVANAFDLSFTHPGHGEKYYIGNHDQFRWTLSSDGEDLYAVVGNIFLMNLDTGHVYDKPLATFLSLQEGTTQWVTIPEVALGNYIIYMQVQMNLVERLKYESAPFSIEGYA